MGVLDVAIYTSVTIVNGGYDWPGGGQWDDDSVG
jgi:hypothetical protein